MNKALRSTKMSMSIARPSTAGMSFVATRSARRRPPLLLLGRASRASRAGPTTTSSIATQPRRYLSSSTPASQHSATPAQGPEEDEAAYAARIESQLFSLPLVKRLMALSNVDVSSSPPSTSISASSPSAPPQPLFKTHRPYSLLPPHLLQHHMTASLMRGPSGFAVRPLCFSPITPPGPAPSTTTTTTSPSSPLDLHHPDPSHTYTYTIYHLGPSLCGHPGIIHGGLISTLLDEGLAQPGFAAFTRTRVGLTTRLEVKFRGIVRPGRFVVVGARRVREEGDGGVEREREGRVEVRGWLRYADEEGGKVLAEARAVFVEPVDEEMVRVLGGSPNASP